MRFKVFKILFKTLTLFPMWKWPFRKRNSNMAQKITKDQANNIIDKLQQDLESAEEVGITLPVIVNLVSTIVESVKTLKHGSKQEKTEAKQNLHKVFSSLLLTILTAEQTSAKSLPAETPSDQVPPTTSHSSVPVESSNEIFNSSSTQSTENNEEPSNSTSLVDLESNTNETNLNVVHSESNIPEDQTNTNIDSFAKLEIG
jgi:hypothetical protein